MLSASESGPHGGPPSQSREASFDGAELLERLARAGMVERGRVVLIGLDAIRERFGERWAKKGDLIWQVAMGHIRRRIGPDDLAARVGECEAVIAVAGDAHRAQSLGLAVLSELLVYFLGQSTPSELRLHQVLWVDGRNLGCAPIDPGAIEPAVFEPKSFAPSAEPAADHPEWTAIAPPTRTGADWSALSLQARIRQLDERFEVEPVISLRHQRLAANRVSPHFTDERTGGRPLGAAALSALPPAELFNLEAAVIEYGFGLLSEGVPLILPLSFQTLSTSRGRALLLQGGGAESKRPIVEITGLDSAPQSRLVEVVSLIAPACRAVIARLEGRMEGMHPRWGQRLEGLRNCRLGGISIASETCRDLGMERASGLIAAAREIGPVALGFHVPDAQALAAAGAAGLTHAALKPPDLA